MEPAASNKLPKSLILSGLDSFQTVFREKNSSADGYLLIYGMPNQRAYSRFGISIGRKYGNAVARNRCKRCIREAFRLNRQEIPSGYDFVIVPRPNDNISSIVYISSLKTLTARIAKRSKKKGLL